MPLGTGLRTEIPKLHVGILGILLAAVTGFYFLATSCQEDAESIW